MDIDLMQTALSVLRTCTERVQPSPDEVDALRQSLGAEADDMAVDDLARTIVERCMYESRRSAAAQS